MSQNYKRDRKIGQQTMVHNIYLHVAPVRLPEHHFLSPPCTTKPILFACDPLP